MYFTENQFEQAVLEVLREQDYNVLSSGEIQRDYRNPLYMDELEEALFALNPGVPSRAIEEALRKLQALDVGTLVQKNKVFTDWLQNGMEISFEKKGRVRHALSQTSRLGTRRQKFFYRYQPVVSAGCHWRREKA